MIVSITQYGAKPNGALCTKPIQQAINDCFLAGGGEVTVPAGDCRVLTGTLVKVK